MRRIVFAIIMVASLAVALLPMSPLSVLHGLEEYQSLSEDLQEYNLAKTSVSSAIYDLRSAQTTFNAGRTFELSYGDIDGIVDVLSNIATVSVSSCSNVDAEQTFAVLGKYSAGDDYSAVKLSLVVEDMASTLNILDKMQLPIYQIYTQEPGMIDVIFLTGGGIE